MHKSFLNTSFTYHSQYHYCQNVWSFQKARFAYYLNSRVLTYEKCKDLFLSDKHYDLFDLLGFQENLKRFECFNPDVVIITATHNRSDKLKTLYESIIMQQFNEKIAWLVIENGSSDDTIEQLIRWSILHEWIIFLNYKSPFGYAAPVRNRGLSFVQFASKYCLKQRWIWVVDSDDYLHNEFVIRELYKNARKYKSTITHGYSVCQYEDIYGNLVTTNTIPRNIGSNFPVVSKLKDELESGPQILSGLISCQYLPYFRYPDEFTMEDDTFNQRTMVWTKKHYLKIVAIQFPCLVKKFHFNSMSGKNNRIGDQKIKISLGPMFVSGIRAQAVIGLLHIRDYFTREKI